jgi:hypothetical protein
MLLPRRDRPSDGAVTTRGAHNSSFPTHARRRHGNLRADAVGYQRPDG